jgi:hypothetical protein
MTNEQLIEELLMEAESLGLRKQVLDACEKYLDQGMNRLEAIETAFSEITDVQELDEDVFDHDSSDIDDDDSYSTHDGSDLNWSAFTDYPEDDDDLDWSASDIVWDYDETEDD